MHSYTMPDSAENGVGAGAMRSLGALVTLVDFALWFFSPRRRRSEARALAGAPAATAEAFALRVCFMRPILVLEY